MKTPAPGDDPGRAETSNQQPKSTASTAENLPWNVIRLRTYCERCRSWVTRPTAAACAEAMAKIARITRQREAEAARAEWHRQDRERLRKARGVPRRRPSDPLPKRQPHQAEQARIDRLRVGLNDPEMHPGLMALTRLPIEALERVAAGKSTLASTQWQRLAVLLGRGARP